MKYSKGLNRPLRILFVGDEFYGSNATSLRDAFFRAGHDVVTANTYPYAGPSSLIKRVGKKALPDAYARHVSGRLHAAAVARGLNLNDFDLLIAFKGNYVSADFLNSFPGVKVHYHPDDSGNRHNVSKMYLEAEPYYDLHVTTKMHNVDELRSRGAKDVLFMRCAFDPRWHRRIVREFVPRVGFIGTMRSDRIEALRQVVLAFGEDVLVAGTGWSRKLGDLALPGTILPPQFGLAFSETVARAPIQIGALNSDNRDTHTCRSFEIPAAGGLFVGERSSEHEEIFEDGRTALLYSSTDELLARLDEATNDLRRAQAIATAGHKAVGRAGNTYDARSDTLLLHLGLRK